jgi:hypothetical protein
VEEWNAAANSGANKKNKKEDALFRLQNFVMRLGLQMRQDRSKLQELHNLRFMLDGFYCIYKNGDDEGREGAKGFLDKISRAQ